MATTIKVENGRISGIYKDSNGDTITEPLGYTRFNLSDSADSISAYSEVMGTEVSRSKATVAARITGLANALANLTTNTYQNTKVNYEVKLEGV